MYYEDFNQQNSNGSADNTAENNQPSVGSVPSVGSEQNAGSMSSVGSEQNAGSVPNVSADGAYRYTGANSTDTSFANTNATSNAAQQPAAPFGTAYSYRSADANAASQQTSSGASQGDAQYSPYQNPYVRAGGEPQQPPQPRQNRATKPPKPPKPPKNQQSNGMGRFVAAALVCALIGGGVGGGAVYAALGGRSAGTGTSISVTSRTGDADATGTTPQNTAASGSVLSDAEIYNTYVDSVVCVTVETNGGTGAGTGFFISDDGYILTCYHVVNGAQAISVTLTDSTSYEATYVGGDEEQDVAVLKVNSTDGQTFHSVVLGKSEDLGVGDDVLTIGNALGTLANTLTSGSVSALDRAITMSDGSTMNLMQTDCTINSGNSGGPLFNTYGEVVGIVNSKYSSSAYTTTASIEGIGFAIPIDDVNDILSDLMQYGYITGKPYLGVSVSTVSAITAQQYSNMVVGAYVNAVNTDSAAEKAGLQAGDIIIQADDATITSSAELISAIDAHKSGEEITFVVYRNGENLTIKATLGEKQPDSANSSSENNDSSNYGYYGYGNDGGNGNSGEGIFGYGW